MEDEKIVALYWERSENAIAETEAKYGAFCLSVARNLLDTREDAEECVNSTYLEAWNSMPTQRPTNLRAWLGRVVRNLSISTFRRNHAQKRYAGMEVLLSELDDCVPGTDTPETAVEAAEIGRATDTWLRSLPAEDRKLFLRRYWNGEPLNRIAEECGIDPAKLAQKMYRLRKSLKQALEKEGITV